MSNKSLTATMNECRSMSTFHRTDPALKELLAAAAHHLWALNGLRGSETGWLIERRRDGQPVDWLDITEGFDGLEPPKWTTESTKAIRFCRRQDAEAYYAFHIDDLPDTYITDHKWLDIQLLPEQQIELAKVAKRYAPLSGAQLEELFREPETVDQICDRVGKKLREEIRAIWAESKRAQALIGSATPADEVDRG